MKKLQVSSAVVISMAFACSTSVYAQEPIDWGPVIRGIAINSAIDEAAREGGEKRQGDDLAPSTAISRQFSSDVSNSGMAADNVSMAATSYRPSLPRRRANLAQFVAKTRAKDPGQADQLQQLFASTDIMAQIAQGLSPYGLSITNLADAYTVYWMNAWQAAYGDLSEDFTREQVQAVRQQAAAAILSTPQFAGITDAQKQEMAEAMLIQAALIASAGEEAQGDPETLARIGAAVKQGAKASGFELDKMVLTPEGFRLR